MMTGRFPHSFRCGLRCGVPPGLQQIRISPAPQSFSVASHQHRRRHESQNENQNGDGGPDEARAVERFPWRKKGRVAEAERKKQSSPQIPASPVEISERNQEERECKRCPFVILACRCVQNMSAIKLASGK